MAHSYRLVVLLCDATHAHFCGLGLGRFSFLASRSFVILNVSISNLILERFSRSTPRGSLPSSDTCFIYKITSEFSLKLLSMAFMRPNAKIFYFRRFFLSIFSYSAFVYTATFYVTSSYFFSDSSSSSFGEHTLNI